MKKPLITTKHKPLIKFVEEFDTNNPEWTYVPSGFPQCDLDKLTSTQIGKFNAIKTIWELSKPEKPKQRSRMWQDPKGYQYLGVWQNAALLRILVRKFTLTLPLNESRLKAQMDDCARSVKRNIEEGWKRATTSEYLQFLSYSQGSLEELHGDVRDCMVDGFLKTIPNSNLLSKGIDLRVSKGPQKGKVWGEPTEPTHPYYKPLITLKPNTLTYEMFIELVNKTDYLLRKLVESLENKLNNEKMYYKVEQARIKEKTKKK